MEIQQTSLYAKYIKQLGWSVLSVDDILIFCKKIPFYGVIAKIQRPLHLPYIPKLVPLLLVHHVKTVIVEPTKETDTSEFHIFMKSLSKFFRIYKEPFLPTKTIIVDITKPETELFASLTEAKRRAVRKALKNNIIIHESNSISDMLSIKNKSAGLFGNITTYGIDKLWNIFYPEHATTLLAYYNKRIVGGILLLFYDNIAYYWIAGASKEGKKLFAPTLLVWEALKLAKLKKNTHFDFVGVFDERSPKQFTSWKGFTKFKEGFGGYEIYYPTTSSS